MITANEQDFFDGGNYRIVDDSKASIRAATETLEGSDKIIGSFGLMIMCEDTEKTFLRFAEGYERIVAAGGLVFNERNELLLIKRQGKWDLPKGKVDAGETVEEAGLREVKEECNIDGLTLGELVHTSHHTYFLDGKRVLKTTHWYKMTATNYKRMKPQLEENITELEWVDPEKLDIGELDTYNSIRDLLRKFLERN